MSRRGLKWAVVAASLVLILLGIHLAWERQRYRLETPKGTIRVGMTWEEVREALGPSHAFNTLDEPDGRPFYEVRRWTTGVLSARYDDGLVVEVTFSPPDGPIIRIPRPSLVEHIRSWLTGKK
jgi:hypothetical protein